MGWVLDAHCEACDFAQGDLKLGATHVEIAQHDVCHREIYRAPCCGSLQSVLIYLGQPLPDVACERCGEALSLAPERRCRIATLKGERLAEHPCPACGADRLRFVRRGEFV